MTVALAGLLLDRVAAAHTIVAEIRSPIGDSGAPEPDPGTMRFVPLPASRVLLTADNPKLYPAGRERRASCCSEATK
jgi:hypothetical protein